MSRSNYISVNISLQTRQSAGLLLLFSPLALPFPARANVWPIFALTTLVGAYEWTSCVCVCAGLGVGPYTGRFEALRSCACVVYEAKYIIKRYLSVCALAAGARFIKLK